MKVFTDVLGHNYVPTPRQKLELEQFVEKFGSKNYNAFKRVVWFVKYDLDNYTERYELSKSLGAAQTEASFIVRFGDIEGPRRWNEYKTKQSVSNGFEYKQQKHGWSKTEFDEYNKSRSSTLQNFVRRHGESYGLEKWNQYLEAQRYSNTLAYFQEKYGSDEGIRIFLQYNHDKGSSRRYSDLLNSGLSHEEICDRISPENSCVSNAEKDFVDKLSTAFGKKFKYTYETKQFCIYDSINRRPYFYDICDPTINIIIEFNGDLWHANPKKYQADDIMPIVKKKARDIWEFDYEKTKVAINRGFRLLKVWESEYKLDKNSIIEDTIQWIKQK